MRTAIALCSTFVLLAACKTDDRAWAAGVEASPSVSERSLRVTYPDREWAPAVAGDALGILVAGQQVARERAGLDEGPFLLALVETEASTQLDFQTVAVQVGTVWYAGFPAPIVDAEAVAESLAAGETLSQAKTGPLSDIRYLTIFLQCHELAHVMAAHTLGFDTFHLWLNEGLAEFVGLETGRVLDSAGAIRFLRERLSELDKLGANGTLDFLRWSPADGGERMHATSDGTVYGWDDAQDVDDVAEGVATLRRLERDDPSLTTLLGQWEEWHDVLTTPRAPNAIDINSDDRRRRWGVYAALLAFMLEAAGEPRDLSAFVSALRASTEPAYTVLGQGAGMEQRPRLHATNATVLRTLLETTGFDGRELARAYPVERARRVLEREIERIAD